METMREEHQTPWLSRRLMVSEPSEKGNQGHRPKKKSDPWHREEVQGCMSREIKGYALIFTPGL